MRLSEGEWLDSGRCAARPAQQETAKSSDAIGGAVTAASGGDFAFSALQIGGDAESVSFDFGPPKTKAIQLFIKRTFDVLGAFAGLLLLGPVMMSIALLVKANSRGPVFFVQERTGLGNKTFRIIKYRTMYSDRSDVSGVLQTFENDSRVTSVGRILRRTNLDELPQLLNVLIGQMSLVGPRPHVPGMLAAGVPYEELVLEYKNRHNMRPGITGLAQVNGLGGPTTDHELAVLRIARDLEYVCNFSLWLDLKILLRTFATEVRGGTGF